MDTIQVETVENIAWSPEEQGQVKGRIPDAKYGPVSEALRHKFPEGKTCSMFCGGAKCKYDNEGPWDEKTQQVVKGLYSNWITDNILAMARPNCDNINKYKQIEQFQDLGIKSIINCQIAGEHCTCGPPLHASGFSYNPQEFMDNGIFFYNFGWPDYNVGSMKNITDMVKVMQYALSEGKVAVHCHAGLGRTGVLIGCYLVFNNKMNPNDAVHYIRSKRPNSVQTRSQVRCVQEFAKYLTPFRVIFSDNPLGEFSLPQFLIRQKEMLHGYEGRTLRHIPKILYVCAERLLELANRKHVKTIQKDNFKSMRRNNPGAFENKTSEVDGDEFISSREEEDEGGFEVQKSKSLPATAMSRLGVSSTSGLHLSSSASSFGSTDNLDESPAELEDNPNLQEVAAAMAKSQYSSEVKEKINQHKTRLNEDTGAWAKLSDEEDCEVLSGLIWNWMDHLQEPILNAQDMQQVLMNTDDPFEGLTYVSKGAAGTIEYMAKVLSRIWPISEELEMNILQRFISVLIHLNIDVDNDPVLNPKTIRRTANEGDLTGHASIRIVHFFGHLVYLSRKKNNGLMQAKLKARWKHEKVDISRDMEEASKMKSKPVPSPRGKAKKGADKGSDRELSPKPISRARAGLERIKCAARRKKSPDSDIDKDKPSPRLRRKKSLDSSPILGSKLQPQADSDDDEIYKRKPKHKPRIPSPPTTSEGESDVDKPSSRIKGRGNTSPEDISDEEFINRGKKNGKRDSRVAEDDDYSPRSSRRDKSRRGDERKAPNDSKNNNRKSDSFFDEDDSEEEDKRTRNKNNSRAARGGKSSPRYGDSDSEDEDW